MWNLARVIANECECCDTFLFADVSSSDGCKQVLSSVTIIRVAGDRASAGALARQLKEAVAVTKEITFADHDLEFSSVGWPSKTVNQSASLDVVASGQQYLLRLNIYRVIVPER
jgi:hypothetical protein